MLAAHRDQENVVLSHHIPTKQAPKTPGIRFPKTPSRLGQRDENGLLGLGKKSELADGKHLAKGNNMMTPIAPQTRTILGNKTTNAKARTVQSKAGGVKGIAKEVEKSQIQQSTIRKSRQQHASSRRLFLTIQQDSSLVFDEPEYAPPQPKPLAYQSDVLPDGGLTFEGIKMENIFKGYHQHFINPLDDDGVSRVEKLLDGEMSAVYEKAIQRNQTETNAFSWNAADVSKQMDEMGSEMNVAPKLKDNHWTKESGRNTSTMSSCRTAAALATLSKTSQSKNPSGPLKKPAAPKARSNESNHLGDPALIPRCANDSGEGASRTINGYAKGSSMSTLLYNGGEAHLNRHARATRTVPIFNSEDAQLITESAPLRQIASGHEKVEPENVQSKLSIIFWGDDDDMDLPPMPIPFEDSDGDGEFEMKLEF